MRASDAFDDRQPQPRAGGAAARRAAAAKRLLHRLDVGRGDAVAGVGHVDPAEAGVVAGAEHDRRTTVAQRVLDQVDDGTPDQRPPHRDDGVAARVEPDRLALLRERPGDIVGQRRERDRLERQGAVVDPREIEELADDLVHLVDAAAHAGDDRRLGVAGEDLDAQAQLGQRRAQVVRDAGEHEGAFPLGPRRAAARAG